MIFEMRTYAIRPGKVNAYLQHFKEVGFPIISKYATLVGYWYTDIGELNQVVHIWSYDSFDDRARKRAALQQDQEWQTNFLPQAMTMLEKQENMILLPSSFSPIQ